VRPSTCGRTFALAVAAACLLGAADKPPDAVLVRAIDYVAQFERTFSVVTWRERYEQEDRRWERSGTSGAKFTSLFGRRTLEAQLLLVWLPRDATFIAVRDVTAIDGQPRPASEQPLDQLASNGSSISVARLQTLAAENGRFNIGNIVRTFSEPTLTLTFLDEHYRHRFKFKRQEANAYSFDEKERPTVIRSDGHDVPARGTIWIEPETGRITQTFMALPEVNGLQGRMTVRYGPYPGFDVFVPLEMQETYRSSHGEEVTGKATYSDFRRFETSGRIIVP
jgi:hypothetical protein